VVPGRERAERVELQVVERAGQVRVAVRSNDAQLTQSLQEQVGELVSRLEQTGFRTESWQPASAAAALDAAAAPAEPRGDTNSREQGEPRQHQPGSPQDDGRQHRRGRDDSRPQWLEELESSFGRNDSTRRILNGFLS
jgi:hypothetical protein